MSKFKKLSDRRPAYGEPLILRVKGVVQHITYMLDGADDFKDWLEPYYFEEKEAGFFVDYTESHIEWLYVDGLNQALDPNSNE